MYDFALHQNIDPYKKFKKQNNIFSIPQRLYWLDGSAHFNKTTEKQNKNHKNKAITLFIIGIGLLFLSKNVQKKSSIFLENIKEFLENKIDKSSFKKSSHKTSFYEYSINKINSFIKKTESINNFNSVKDILFMRFMYKTTPTKKIHQSISKFFEYLSKKTVTKSYKKTQKNFNEMYKNFDLLDEYILKNSADEIVEYKNKKMTKRELIDSAKDLRFGIQMVVDAFINPKTQDARYQSMKNTTSELNSKFWDESFKGFWTKENKFKRKEMWQTFIAAEQIESSKTELAERVAFARNMLSYTDSEKKLYISDYIKNLNNSIPIEDDIGKDIIRKLKWYIKDTASLRKNNENFVHELNKLESHNIKLNSNKSIADMQLKDKNINIKLIKDIINDSDEGEIQDMIDIYRKISPFELSKSGALDSMKKAVTSFDKSVKLEIGEMFDKLRDLEIGSAPTDILTILISSVMIIRALENAHNDEERSSIILKSGIPIIGAISVSLISATKLISGTKSLALGFISGIILNRIGKFLSENYK